MYYLEKIILENFLSHKLSEISFKKDKLHLLIGQNLDLEEGSNSNGSGKSGVIEAIYYGIIGKLTRDVLQEDYILTGEKKSRVKISLKDNKDKSLTIERNFSVKGSSLEITYDNQTIPFTDILEGNKIILQYLDLTQEQIENYFILTQENSFNFLLATEAEKKKTLQRIIKGEVVEKTIELIKDDQKTIEKEINLKEREKISIESKIEIYLKEIEKYKLQYDILSREANEDRDKKVSLIDGQIVELEKETIEINEILREKQKLIKELDIEEDLKILKEKKQEIIQEIHESGSCIRHLNDLLKGIEISLAHKITCPNCQHNFILKADKSIEELKQEEKDLKEMLETSKNCEKREQEELELIDKQINSFAEKKAKKYFLGQEIKEHEQSLKRTSNQILSKKKEIESIGKETNNILENYLTTIQRAEIENKTLKESLILVLNELKFKEKEKKELFLIVDIFSRERFQAFLTKKALDLVETTINYFLNKFDTDIRVQLLNFQELKSKEIKNKISVRISRIGIKDQKIEKLSGGEKNKLNVATILSFQKILNSKSKKGLDLLILDETFANLDQLSTEYLINFLGKLNRMIVLVSHQLSENQQIEANKIVIQKRNKISKAIDSVIIKKTEIELCKV